MFQIGYTEVVLLLVIVALLLGSFMLPKNAKSAHVPIGEHKKDVENKKLNKADINSSNKDLR